MRARNFDRRSTCLAGLALVFAFAALPASAAPTASAADQCISSEVSNEARVAACSAVIADRKSPRGHLVVAYCNRGYSLTELGQYDRVIANSNAALRIDAEAPVRPSQPRPGVFLQARSRPRDRGLHADDQARTRATTRLSRTSARPIMSAESLAALSRSTTSRSASTRTSRCTIATAPTRSPICANFRARSTTSRARSNSSRTTWRLYSRRGDMSAEVGDLDCSRSLTSPRRSSLRSGRDALRYAREIGDTSRRATPNGARRPTSRRCGSKPTRFQRMIKTSGGPAIAR